MRGIIFGGDFTDNDCMKCGFFYAAVVFTSLFLIFSGCAGAPEKAEEVAAPADDVWALLGKGDGSAKDYFLGKVDVHAKDELGRTPLHYAAETMDANLAAFFISLGAKVDERDNEGQTPLGISAEKKDAAVARLLAGAGADIHLPAQNGETPAQTAIASPDISFLRAILTASSAESTDGDGRTILHMASFAGNVDAVREILAVDGSTDKRDNAGKNALDLALSRPDSRNHMASAELLILSDGVSDSDIYPYFAPAVRSANYNIRRADGMTAMHFAAGLGHEGLISFLVEKKADVNIKNNSGAAPLHEAARSGNISIMRMLLDQGADVNAQDAKGNSALHIGIPVNAHEEAVALFLQRGANPNLRDEHGESPLHILITLNRSPRIVEALLDGGADANIRNIDGKTPLYLAVENNRVSLIPLLTARGADIFAADNEGLSSFDRAMLGREPALNALINAATVLQSDSAGNTMLHAAVKNRGEPALIGRILDQKALVNARNKEGDTALHLTVRLNQRENGELLISRGADIFAPNSAGESPLYLAFSSAGNPRYWLINPQTVRAKDGLGNSVLHYLAQWKLDAHIPFVIESGVSTETVNATGETPLFAAVKFDGTSTIRTLLDAKANLNARDSLGNSALHAAVRWNAANSAAVLLDAGIDINAHSLSGKTPLHDSVRLGISDLETLLIEKGAGLEVRDSEGNTPFMEAVMAGYVRSIDRLAEHGADPMTRNIRGDTPLHIAVAGERSDLVNPLLHMGVSIHARNTRSRTPFQLALHISSRMVSVLLTKDRINNPDDFGNSALHIALQEKVPANILRVIIDQGCRLTAVDSNGRTPLRCAIDAGMWENAKLLADSGSDPFSTAADGKTPAEIALAAGENGLNALFSGKAINARDSSGNTILHYAAARRGNTTSIALLMTLGAHKDIRNIAAESPYDIAVRWNIPDNASLLE